MVVTITGTTGWGTSSAELAAALGRCGVTVTTVDSGPVADVRTLMLTDLLQARATRRAAATALAAQTPRAIVYCSITAALLWPRPGAIWLDAAAAQNRPGRHGLWQRPVERRRLGQAPVVMAMSPPALDGLAVRPRASAVVPVPVEPSVAGGSSPGVSEEGRDIHVLAYVPDPQKKQLDLVLGAWDQARRPEERMVVAGVEAEAGGSQRSGVDYLGRLPRAEFRALLRRARVFLAAPLFEDYGTTQLEALADGCRLVTTAGGGPYPARELARTLDSRLVGTDLTRGVRTALDDPVAGYGAQALELLRPFRRQAMDDALARQVLPKLLG